MKLNSRHLKYSARSEKYQTDHAAPLYRFLEKSVGQKWNTVYSRICARLDCRTLDRYHFLQHVGFAVQICVNDISGFLLGKSGTFYQDLYVHPKTGILCRLNKPSFEQTQLDANRKMEVSKIAISELLHLVKKNGYWFTVKYWKHEPNDVYRTYTTDGGEPQIVRWSSCESLFEEVGRKQANKKEIAKIHQLLSITRVRVRAAGKNPVLLHSYAKKDPELITRKSRYEVTLAIPARSRRIWTN